MGKFDWFSLKMLYYSILCSFVWAWRPVITLEMFRIAGLTSLPLCSGWKYPHICWLLMAISLRRISASHLLFLARFLKTRFCGLPPSFTCRFDSHFLTGPTQPDLGVKRASSTPNGVL